MPNPSKKLVHTLIAKSIIETLLVGALAVFAFTTLFPPYFHGWGEVVDGAIVGWAVNNKRFNCSSMANLPLAVSLIRRALMCQRPVGLKMNGMDINFQCPHFQSAVTKLASMLSMIFAEIRSRSKYSANHYFFRLHRVEES